MLSAKNIAGFFVRFVVVFAVLMAPWPGVDETYAALFRAVGNVIFVRFGSAGTAQFRPLAEPASNHELELSVTNRRTNTVFDCPFSSRKQGYKPTAFVLALTLATPIPWSRRWRAVLWAFLWVNLYVVLKTAVFVFSAFSGDAQLALVTLGPISTKILIYVHWVVVASFAGWSILPLPIWALVTFRRKDWEAVLRKTTASPKADSTAGK